MSAMFDNCSGLRGHNYIGHNYVDNCSAYEGYSVPMTSPYALHAHMHSWQHARMHGSMHGSMHIHLRA